MHSAHWLTSGIELDCSYISSLSLQSFEVQAVVCGFACVVVLKESSVMRCILQYWLMFLLLKHEKQYIFSFVLLSKFVLHYYSCCLFFLLLLQLLSLSLLLSPPSSSLLGHLHCLVLSVLYVGVQKGRCWSLSCVYRTYWLYLRREEWRLQNLERIVCHVCYCATPRFVMF